MAPYRRDRLERMLVVATSDYLISFFVAMTYVRQRSMDNRSDIET